MPVIEIDFETRSKVDIRKCGAGRYAADPSTRILCTCWAVDGGPVRGVYGETIPHIFRIAVKEGWTFSAFNAMFEQLIWYYRWGKDLPVPEFMCTRSMVAAHGLPQSLDKACRALRVGYAKDLEGTRLINTYSKPRKDGSFLELAGEDKAKMLKYCARDVLLSRRIRQRLPALVPFEQQVYDWTVRSNIRGITIDRDLAIKAGNIASYLLKQGNKEMGELTGGTIFSVTQVERIKKFLAREFNITPASLDKEAIQELLLDEGLPEKARRILELRRDLSQTSVKKFERAAEAICADGKVRDTLVYHGASTGRWTSQVVQFQNLPRHTLPDPEVAYSLIAHNDPELFEFCYLHPMAALTACVRGMVLPSKGRKLAVVDYNAIEARVLMWAAGQTDAVQAFQEGRDIYVEMAQVIYHKKGLTKENKAERQLGKQAILGCGYGMGHSKFRATCTAYNIKVDEGLAERAVKAYRGTYKEVPKFWYGMEEAAKMCVRTKKAFKYRGFTFHWKGEFLYMNLPSGRDLAYHHAGIDNEGLFYFTQDSVTNTYGKRWLYGGRLVENAIQALARDILAYGILELEKAGRPVILTIHDENVIDIPDEDPRYLEQIIDVMCDLPEWADGCPITAEGFICDRYRKG